MNSIKNVSKFILVLSSLALAACGGSDNKEVTETVPPAAQPVSPSPEQPESVPPVDTAPESPLPLPVEPPVAKPPFTPLPETPVPEYIDPNMQVPSNLKVSTSNSNIRISWVSVNNATSYRVYVSHNEDVTLDSESFSTDKTSHTEQGIYQSIHYYRIQAVLAEAGSELSNTIKVDLTSDRHQINDTLEIEDY